MTEKNRNYPDDKDRILLNINIDQNTSCWEWRRFKNPKGYGMVRYNGKTWLAHRLSHCLLSNPGVLSEVPDGLCVLHRCDNPGCVNPTHLFLGTRADNSKDRDEKGRGACRDGEKNGRAKLTEDEVVTIREINRVVGITRREISEAFGVGYTAVVKIVTGKTWKHTEEREAT